MNSFENERLPRRTIISAVTAGALIGALLSEDNLDPATVEPYRYGNVAEEVRIWQKQERTGESGYVYKTGDNPFTDKPDDQLQPLCVAKPYSAKPMSVQVDAYVKGLGYPLRGFVSITDLPSANQANNLFTCDGSQAREAGPAKDVAATLKP